MIVIDIEGKERIEAMVFQKDGIFNVYSAYGIDASELNAFLDRNGIEIEWREVDKYAVLQHLNEVFVGWNLKYDLRMLTKEFYSIIDEIEYIDLYMDILEHTGMHYTLWKFVYETYGIRVQRYRAYREIERMYRYMKCIVDVYLTSLVYNDFKDITKIRVYTAQRYI